MVYAAVRERKTFRKFRIAFSAFSAVACILLMLWWARSFTWYDDWLVKFCNSEWTNGSSADGRMIIWFEHAHIGHWFELNISPLAGHRPAGKYERLPWFRFFRSSSGNSYSLCFAHCLLAIIMVGTALVPWCPRRFSVRGLLVTTTVVALVIGLTIWIDSFY
jgi:hypothetical protein